MTTPHANCSLYLHPARADFTFKTLDRLIHFLQAEAFIADKINPAENDMHFFTGDDFLEHIAYMGCAPAIQFEANNGKTNFCSIKIHQHASAKLIVSKTQARNPHCPACNKPVKDWQQHLTETTIDCSECGKTSDIESFNWRKMAGFSRLFIEITDIFPKEAIPQPLFMERLTDSTQTGWRYFYSCK